MGLNLHYGCQNNNVDLHPEIATVFNNYQCQGSMGIYNNAKGKFWIYNLENFRDTSYPVGQSLALLMQLIALNNGVISLQNEHLLQYNLQSIYSNYYDTLITAIGVNNFNFYRDSLQYGGKYKLNNYQFDSLKLSLRLTCDEQLGFIKKLYFNKLPFQERNQQLLKNAFNLLTVNDFTIHYTAFDLQNNQRSKWVLGWLETSSHPLPFAIKLSSNFVISNEKIALFLKELAKKINL